MIIQKSKKAIYDAEEMQQKTIKEIHDLMKRYYHKDRSMTLDERREFYSELGLKLHDLELRSAFIQNRCHDLW